jgi:hypothetical protein
VRVDAIQTITMTAWLFTRGDESIRMVQSTDRIELHVLGPGSARSVHQFDTTVDLVVWQMDVERQLRSSGWSLERFLTDRRRVRERRTRRRGADRRLAV